MRLKHLEQGIHLPHTSKYHLDAIDIYPAIEKTAGVDGLHHESQCLWKEHMEGWSDKINKGQSKSLEIKKRKM